MSNMLKCPNPSCPYVFDPSQVPVGVVLSCPRCAMQFTLGAPNVAPPSTTSAFPPNQPQAPFPPTEPDMGAVVRPTGPASRVSQRAAAARGDKSRDRQAASGGAPPTEGEAPRGNFQVFAIAGVVAVLLAGAALAIIFVLMRRGGTETPDTVIKLPDLNAGVEALPPGWTRDDSVKVKVGSPFAISFKRENPEAYVAFGANAFGSDHKKGRNPRPSEMKADVQQALAKLFVTRGDESLRSEDPLANKWLGESISSESPQYPNGFSFRAPSSDGVRWRGEVYTVAHKGMAYYWLGWCPEENFDGLKSEFAAFRDKFRVLELRKDWNASQASVIDYKGDKVPYTLSDAEDVWKEAAVTDDERKYEPDLDKLLRLRITPRGNRHALPDEAELRVYVVDSGGDATDSARDYAQRLEVDRIKLLNPDFKPPTFDILTDPEQGDPISTTAPRTATVVRMQSKLAESRDASRLYVVSGVRSGDKLVVLRAWCEWGKRNVLEARLTQIASSLRP